MSNNIHQLAAWLGDHADSVGVRMGAATQKTVQDTVNTARSLAPVDTGNLRAGIHGTTEIGPQHVIGEVTASAHYAIYVEHGTSRMAPQPYMRPAQDAHTSAWLQAIAQAGGIAR